MVEPKTVVHGAETLVIGPDPDDTLEICEDGAVAIGGGHVLDSGPSERVCETHPPAAADIAIDASGKTVLPGFVDSHTHAVFAGDRADEYEARLKGTSYQELLAEGGGILRTVDAVRNADLDTLRDRLIEVLDEMLSHGATTVEVKSGYGLDVDSELRMLRAIEAVDDQHPTDLVSTFLGAHAVPPDTDSSTYIEQVVEDQLPAVVEANLAEFVDVFCDEGAFTLEQARTVLKAASDAGLDCKIHADEFARLGGAQLAAELGAASADHLLLSTPDDASALADAGVVPTLLPGTPFTLGESYADPDIFIEAGSYPALASDFNPNCYLPSMMATIQLACHGMGMTPSMAIRGGTASGANAINRGDRTGHLRGGAVGDLIVADVPTHVHLTYQIGVNPVETVVKGGEIVHG